MALPGYPQTYDHPKMTIIEEGDTVTGKINYIKSFGNTSTDWIEYQLKYINSETPAATHTLRVNVGTSLYGPFSSVKHHEEGPAGPSGSPQDCWTQIFETEA